MMILSDYSLRHFQELTISNHEKLLIASQRERPSVRGTDEFGRLLLGVFNYEGCWTARPSDAGRMNVCQFFTFIIVLS